MQLDFTLLKYEKLCSTVHAGGAHVVTIHEYLTQRVSKRNIVIFRHDVDRDPRRALQLAQLEHRCGIKSTYYFRVKKRVFIPEIIQEISRLGHEIGYHYETLAECKGDYERAIALFEEELAQFREISSVTTISMHGRPLSKFDNRDLWKKYDFRDYDLIGECYLSID